MKFRDFFKAEAEVVNETSKVNKKNIARGSAFIVVIVLVILSFVHSIYTVKESEYALISTFGKVHAETVPGIHFKIPFVQDVKTVTKNIIGLPIGYEEGTGRSIEQESLMITLDYNFINADFYIEYQISDPILATYKSENAFVILKNLAQSYIRDTIGLVNVDDILTNKKFEIQTKIRDQLRERMEKENLGISIINVTIQDAEPPTEEVKNAFKEVETAKQGKETAINKANAYKNEKVPESYALIDKIIKEANAEKLNRINEATGQVARFNSVYSEYLKYPLISKKRMFYEVVENVFPDLKIVIDLGDGVNKMLPIEKFVE